MTDRLEQIKTRGYFVGGARSERTQQLMEDFEWLLKDNERMQSIVEQHYLCVQSLEDESDEQHATIATLRGELMRDAAASLLTIKHKDATIATLWDSIQPLRLEVDELRAALDATTADRMYEQERTIAKLREAMEEIKPILKAAHFAHCYYIVEKALAATEPRK